MTGECVNVVKQLLLAQLSNTPLYTQIAVRHELMNQSPMQISRELGVSRSTVSAYIGKLRNATHLSTFRIDYCLNKYRRAVKKILSIPPVMTKTSRGTYHCTLCGKDVMVNRKMLHLIQKHSDYIDKALDEIIRENPPQPIKVYTPDKGLVFISRAKPARPRRSKDSGITVNV